MLSINTLRNAKIVDLPSDRARMAFIDLLCEAKIQKPEGVFASMNVLRMLAKHRKESIPALLDAKLLHAAETMCERCTTRFGEVPEKAIVVHDWQDYQEPLHHTGTSRTTRWRQRAGVTSGHENLAESVSPVSPGFPHARAGASVSRSSSSSPEETDGSRPHNGDEDSLDTYYDLTRFRPWGVWSGDRLHAAENDYGIRAVQAALHAEHEADPDRKSLLDRVSARLARDADREKRSKVHRSKRKSDPDAEYAARARAVEELMREMA